MCMGLAGCMLENAFTHAHTYTFAHPSLPLHSHRAKLLSRTYVCVWLTGAFTLPPVVAAAVAAVVVVAAAAAIAPVWSP